ncbi:LysR family transcriptional regulator [Paenibacillus aceris]|uniref:DNA-binding transcriptional LysR family regulator n=1 Tax=Paenibacillus aceris TaxID=869555 RepID=A0ABS4I531_9BACL|nr:LysR family transcriptional regulator [Paenibacillus aceris]MBP1965636.1 DNA-binding transcriptional LysR family regulator [Paenibacillus aceris]NHW36354.1 LysR family transcriptional regulator [Paenibacillus aceris]
MELRQIEYFIAVAEELHFGRAAKRLQMTQPPLSQQILQLEKELGVMLFERSKRHVELTNAGKVFLQESLHALTQLEQAKAAAQRAQMGMLGRLVLGFVGSATFDILPNLVRAFQDQYPYVDLVLHEMPTPMQIEAFRRKDIDIGFVRTPVVDRLLSLLSVHQETCIAVVPKLHPLAQRSSVSMGDLSAERFILVEREVWPSWYDDIVTKCREAGFSPIIRQNVKEIQTVVGLVAAGLGISIVPSSTANLHARDVAYVNIEGNAPRVDMSIAWRTDNNSPIVKQFLETAVRLTGCDFTQNS